MKPRTKLQFEVISLSKYLYNIDNKMFFWAKASILDHKGFATKSRVLCMDCGESFSPALVSRKRAVCPHCDTKLKIEQTKKRTDKQRVYIAIAEICEEFQVIRNFELCSYHKSGEAAKYYIDEILQHWILPNGKREIVARNHSLNWYVDSWNGDMEIRKHYPKYYSSSDRYDIYPYRYHPDSQFKAEYKLYGINHNLQGLTFPEAIKLLPDNPKAETLLKAKQYGLLGYLNGYDRQKIECYWPSIKICLRNKYRIKDVKMWFDYLDLLSYFGKDLHNAHYVCPKNLHKEHDRLVARKRRIQARQEAERKHKKLLQDEKKFKDLKAMFFGIAFSDHDIHVGVLESVKEVMEEGDALHHCVFTNEYYLKPDSLILSAAVNGKPTETIEVSISKLKVVQCRGLQNKNTEHHDRIISLVNKNMALIRNRLKPKKRKQAQKKLTA